MSNPIVIIFKNTLKYTQNSKIRMAENSHFLREQKENIEKSKFPPLATRQHSRIYRVIKNIASIVEPAR
jgi:hypothetical protein